MSYDDFNVPTEQQFMLENQWTPEDEQQAALMQQGGSGFMPEQVLETRGNIVYDGNDPYGYLNDDGAMQPYFNTDGSAAVSSNDYEPEKPSLWDSFTSGLGKTLGNTVDANGRQQQSFAASIILGAASSVLKSMQSDKTIRAERDMENQQSGNRIKERTEEENRLRAAASAMPTYFSRKSVGLLSSPRGLK